MKRREFVVLGAMSGAGASVSRMLAWESGAGGDRKRSQKNHASSGNYGESMSGSAPMIITPGDAHVYNMGLGEARILIDGERSRGAWWLGEFREDPGFMTTLHLHYKTDEQFFVLEGVLSMYVGGKWHDLQPGSLGLVPRNTPHAQGNAGEKPVKFLASGNPAGFERFFGDLDKLVSRLAPSDPSFDLEADKVMMQNDSKTIGPPPPRDRK